MSDIMERLVGLGREIDALDAAIRDEVQALESPSTVTKRFPLFESVAFVFPLSSNGTPPTAAFAPREQFWNNASWDAYITEVTASVYMEVSGAGVLGGYRLLYDSEAGMFEGDSFGGGTGVVGAERFTRGVVFDYEWNFRLPASGRVYGNGNARYLSRKSLGNKYTDQMLRFTDPLYVKAGDSVVWMLRPTVFNPGSRGIAPMSTGSGVAPHNPVSIVVNMCFNGYRDGTMAEAAYEQP